MEQRHAGLWINSHSAGRDDRPRCRAAKAGRNVDPRFATVALLLACTSVLKADTVISTDTTRDGVALAADSVLVVSGPTNPVLTLDNGATVDWGSADKRLMVIGRHEGESGSFQLMGGSTVTVAGSGLVDAQDFSYGSAYLGYAPGSTGAAVVTGTGSNWTMQEYLMVGGDGSGSLTVTGGGNVSSESILVGAYEGGTGSITVSDAGSLSANWDVSISFDGELLVRDLANVSAYIVYVGHRDKGSVLIEDGGQITSGYGSIGVFGNQATVTVTGAGSQWNAEYAFSLVCEGTGILNVTEGGSLSTAELLIGDSKASSRNVATVTGADSSMSASVHLVVSSPGTARLEVSDGGSVSTSYLRVGDNPSESGELFISGGGSVFAYSMSVGRLENTDGIVTVTGSGTSLTVAGELHLAGAPGWYGDDRAGTLIVEDGATVSIGELLQVNPGGTISGDGGTIIGSVLNFGTVSPGSSAGILTIEGDFTQTSDGQLVIEIGGLVPGSGYDQLAIIGSANLAGTLSVQLTNDFVLGEGMQFNIITLDGELHGTFLFLGQDALVGTYDGVDLYINYSDTGVTLYTVPEPTSATMIGMAGAVLLCRRRRG